MKKIIKGCYQGRHCWKNIMSVDNGYGSDKIVQWCTECGSVIIVTECDGRLMNKGDLQCPEITRTVHAS